MNSDSLSDIDDLRDLTQRPFLTNTFAGRQPGGEMRAKGKARFARVSTNTIMATQFEAIRWIVPDYVPEGFSVLAGRQKLGKTWLAIDWALAVATGGAAMGSIPVDPGNVLYIDMENGQRRVQRRIQTLYPSGQPLPDLSRLEWMNDAPPLSKDFIALLDDWRLSVENPRLIVIDVLQRIKPAGNAARNSYENDYSAWAPLQAWAMEHGIAVVGLHHTRKGGADDPLEALSGSNGLSACADTTLVLDRDGNGITLFVRGRDVEERESALTFTSGIWTLTGEAAEVRRTTERNGILTVLTDATEPMNPQDIANAADMKRNNVDRLLGKMVRAGEVLKAGRGRYISPNRTDLLSDPSTPGKNGKKVRNEGSQEGEASGLDLTGASTPVGSSGCGNSALTTGADEIQAAFSACDPAAHKWFLEHVARQERGNG